MPLLLTFTSHRRSPLAMLVALVGLVTADIPWPSSGKLDHPGGGDLLNGAWIGTAASATHPHWSMIANGRAVTNRVESDESLRTSLTEVTSSVCLDDNTVLFIAKKNATNDAGPVQSGVACGVVRVNSTHLVIAQYDETEGKCPDASILADAEAGFEASNTTGITRRQVFKRVDGVLPAPPVLMCKNSTKYTAPVYTATSDPGLGSEAPADLASPLGSNVPVGVWAKPGMMTMSTPRGFATANVTMNGLVGQNGVYLTHECINDSTYVAANRQMRLYFGGAAINGYHCVKGERTDKTLNLVFSNGPDCTELESTDFSDGGAFTLVASIPGFPTECGAAVPDVVPPASSAARAALGGALVVLIAVL
jgi:hypothetical protein